MTRLWMLWPPYRRRQEAEDDLHRRITDAAHDARLSTNRWLTRVADDATRENDDQ